MLNSRPEADTCDVSYYIVAFMDLLGQRDKLRGFPREPDLANAVQMDDLVPKIKDTYGAVITFYETFDNYLRYFSDSRDSRFSPPIAELLHSSRIRRQTFSDGIVIYASLQETSGRVPLNDVFGILGACASVFLLFLAEGKALRGGVDVGVGMETEKHGIYGPIVSDAYELESEVAQFPRIAVGSSLIKYLRSEQLLPQDDPIAQGRSALAIFCQDLITEGDDGCPIIDYLGQGFRDHIAQDILGEAPVRAHDYVTAQFERWHDEGNLKLQCRYGRLKRYFDARMDAWIRT